MDPSELKIGDILFFGTIGGKANHVAMYTGDIDGLPHITHAVRNSTATNSVQTTVLRRKLGRIDVFRPLNSSLAEVASALMLKWASYAVPYDERRLHWILLISEALDLTARNKDNEEPIDFKLKYLTKQAHSKFYERIKFAARRDTSPVKFQENITPRGFTCVQAVILAYQVAELIPFVKTMEQVRIELSYLTETVAETTECWISDKHCPDEVLRTYDLPKSYVKYYNSLRDMEEYEGFEFTDKRDPIEHPHNHPCLVAWRYDLEPSIDAFIDKFNSCLNLPAKICFTDSLYQYMKEHSDSWGNMGILKYNDLPCTFSPEQKQKHQRRKSDLEVAIVTNQNKALIPRRTSSVSLKGDTSPRLGLSSPQLFFTSDSPKAENKHAFKPIKLEESVSSSSLSLDVSSSLSQEVKSPLLARIYPRTPT